MVTSFSGGGSRSTRRKPPTLGKQLVNFITCGCRSEERFSVESNNRSKTKDQENSKKNQKTKTSKYVSLIELPYWCTVLIKYIVLL
jgi:hypothetical protein